MKYIITTNGSKKFILPVNKSSYKYRAEFPGLAYHDYNYIGDRVSESSGDAEGWPTQLFVNRLFKTEEEATIVAYDLGHLNA